MNRDTEAARRFHAATKYVAVRDNAGDEQFIMGTPPEIENPIWQEDWSIEPFPYKVYETLDPIAIPRDFPPTTMPALEALSRTGAEPDGDAVPDLAALARIALLSNGILKRGAHRPGGDIVEYRAAGGTGARYHLELYFVCGNLPGLDAGIYHYSAQDYSLRQLRAGDYRSVLIEASGREEAITAAPVVLIMTSTFWRNAWRYKGRAYRHAFWDAGTTFANVLSLAASAELPTQLVFGFADASVNAVLGIDGQREAALALCAIGCTSAAPPPVSEVSRLDLPTRAISAREVEFPVIGMMHGASALPSGAEAAAWRAEPLRRAAPEAHGNLIPLRPIPANALPTMPIEDIIGKRRSTRHYDTDT
ncbi:MAG: SagB/ThcOx family dehydrogenase, partial [Chloroflexota bacterium]|nr:SagB/ThcOx family dehydrogenase [Chloroflexota bacterium]